MNNIYSISRTLSGSSALYRAIFICMFVFILLLFVLLACGMLPEHSFGTFFDFACACMGCFILVLLYFWIKQQGHFDLFHFPTWISLNLFMQVVIPMWLLDRRFIVVIPWLRSDPGPKMVDAIILFSCGIFFLWIGFILVFQNYTRRRSVATKSLPRLNVAVAMSIWVLCSITSIFSLVSGLEGYLANSSFAWSNYTFFIQMIGWLTWSGLLFHYMQFPSKFGNKWIVFSVGVDLLLGFLAGTRRPLLTMLWLLLHWYYARRSINWRWVIRGVLVAVIFIAGINIYRSILHSMQGDLRMEGRAAAAVESIKSLFNTSFVEIYDDTESTLVRRQGGLLSITASVMYLHPSSNTYIGYDILSYTIAQLTPRLLYPDKLFGAPEIYNISNLYYGFSTSLSAIGQFADSYRAGGWPFVALWFFCLGALSGIIYFNGPYCRHFPAISLYFIFIAYFAPYDLDIATIILRMLQMMPMLWLLNKYVIYRRSRQIPARAINIQALC